MALNVILGWIARHGYTALFAVLTLGIVGAPVPEETLLMFAGYLAFDRKLALLPTFAAAFLGTVCGISVSYGLGRSFGASLVNALGPRLGVDPARLEDVRAWFARRGKYALFFGYFLPGIRHLTAFVAGSSKFALSSFAVFAYSGGLLWSVTFVTLGYVLGEEWAHLSATVHRIILTIVMVALVLACVVMFLRKRQSAREIT